MVLFHIHFLMGHAIEIHQCFKAHTGNLSQVVE